MFLKRNIAFLFMAFCGCAFAGGNSIRLNPADASTVLEVKWPDSLIPIKWEFSTDGYAGSAIDNATVQSQFEQAFNTWEAVATSKLDFTYTGEVDRRLAGFDGHNLVTFTDPNIVFAPGVVGLAFVMSIESELVVTDANNDLDGDGIQDIPNGTYPAGSIMDGDIVFNSSFDYTVTGQNGTLDIQTIALHEVGHFFGLSHSSVPGATMWPFVPFDVTAGRLPSQDDVAYISKYYPFEPNFSGQYGVVKGRVLSGANRFGILGAHVYALDPATGEKIVGGYTIMDGSFNMAVPAGTYYIGVEPLDSDPIALDPKRINQVISFTFDTNFPEELYDANEAEVEADPFDALPVVVTAGAETEEIQIITNTIEVPGYSGLLKKGINLFAFPVSVSTGSTAFKMLQALGSETEINSIERFNPKSNSFERALFINGIPSGIDFTVKRGEGYVIHAGQEHAISFLGSVDCPTIDVEVGFNLIAVPCPPASYSAYDLLLNLGESHEVVSVKRYNQSSQAYETASYDSGVPAGVDFPIVNGEAYVAEMRIAKTNVVVPGKDQIFPPAITGISPGQGVRGAAVSILGQGFNPNPNDNLVTFGSVGARVVYATPTVLTVEVPYNATSGNVQVIINSRTSNAVPFTVISDEVQENPEGETELISGQKANGSLSADGEQDRYTFTALAGSVLTASAESLVAGRPDLLLVLESPLGVILVTDNDSGNGTNPLINAYRLPETGTYTLVVTNVPGSGTGDYQLSLDVSNANAVPKITVLQGDGQSVLAGAALPEPIKVFITGPTGAALSGVPVSVTATNLSLTATNAQLLNAGSSTVSSPGNGVVALDVTSSNVPGKYLITITAPGMAAVSAVVSSLDAEVRSIMIEGDDQDCGGTGCSVGTDLPQPLALTFLDANGDPVEHVLTKWAVAAGGGKLSGSGNCSGSDSCTLESDSNGKTQVTFKLGTVLYQDVEKLLEQQQLAAAIITKGAHALASPILFGAKVKADAPAKLVSNVSNFKQVTMRTATLSAIQLQVLDQYGNPVEDAEINTPAPNSSISVFPGLYKGQWFADKKTNKDGIWVGGVSAGSVPTKNEFGETGKPGLNSPFNISLSVAGASAVSYTVEVGMGPTMVTTSGQGIKQTIKQTVGQVSKRIIRYERVDGDDSGSFWSDEDFTNIKTVGVPNVPIELTISRGDGNKEADHGLNPSTIEGSSSIMQVTDSAGYVGGEVILGDVGGEISVVGKVQGDISVTFQDGDTSFTQNFPDERNFAESTSILAKPVIVEIELEDTFPGISLNPDPYPAIADVSGIDISKSIVEINNVTVYDGSAGFTGYTLNEFPNYRRIWLDGVELKSISLDLQQVSKASRIKFSYWPTGQDLIDGVNTMRVKDLSDNAGNESDTNPYESLFIFP